MLKKFFLIFLIFFTRINCEELEVYQGSIIIGCIQNKEDLEVRCFNNSAVKFIINKPKYDKYQKDLVVCTCLIDLEDFETNPFVSLCCKFWMYLCCCPKKLPIAFEGVWLPLNFFKRNEYKLKSNGDIICLFVKDTKNKIVKLELKIIDQHNVLKLNR